MRKLVITLTEQPNGDAVINMTATPEIKLNDVRMAIITAEDSDGDDDVPLDNYLIAAAFLMQAIDQVQDNMEVKSKKVNGR